MKTTLALLFCALCVFAKPNSRIVGGQIAYNGQFPYVAALYVTKTATVFCTGALISDQWILTAATCLNEGTMVSVYLGTTKLDSSEDTALRATGAQIVLHPDYSADTLANDIALVQLTDPVEFTTRIRPVALPSAPLDDSDYGQVLGWGKTADADTSVTNVLRYATLWAMSDDDCKDVYQDQILENMVCFGSDQDASICLGDIGSPLVKHVNGGNTTVLAIATFVSSNGCEAGDPSGFTKVFEYLDWINDTIEM